MTELEKFEWFKCACGYLTWAMQNGIGAEEQLANITHDLVEIVRDTECFLPRLHKYDQYWKG